MATVEQGLRAQIRNIEATYGKSMQQWFEVIAASGKTKHSDIVAMLKTTYGMTHGSAHRVSLLARQTAGSSPVADHPGDQAEELYTGPKSSLRPVHDALVQVVTAFGDDIELAPKKGYLSLRRRKQFAMIQPSTATRVDVGLILKGGVPPSERLESAAGFNALFSHRVRVTNLAAVDNQLIGWLKAAYDAAG